MSSIQLKTGSCFGGQSKHTLFFTKHLQKEAGDEVCLRTDTQRFKWGKEKNQKTMHLHKRLSGVSFSIQLERE